MKSKETLEDSLLSVKSPPPMPNKSATQRVIELAVKGGYKPYGAEINEAKYNGGFEVDFFGHKSQFTMRVEELREDPSFWQALQKSLRENRIGIPPWKYLWHKFINHLIAGKDPNSFFADLIKNL